MPVLPPTILDAMSGNASWGVIELTITSLKANPIGQWKWSGAPFGGAPVGDWSWGNVGGKFTLGLDTQMMGPFAEMEESMAGKLLKAWRGGPTQQIPVFPWFPQGLQGTGQCFFISAAFQWTVR